MHPNAPRALSWRAVIGALIRGETLSPDEAAWAMNEIMEGAATPVQVAGFGVALRMKGETPGELAGLAEVMLSKATPISVPGDLVNLVGTGGDGAHTVNISTMGAIVAAAAGVRVVKHGNRAASSACGAADVLEALGVVISLPPAASAQLAEETGIAFLFAPLYHPALRHASVARASWRAHRVQLPRPGDQPGPACGVCGRRLGPADGRGRGRGPGGARHLGAGVPRQRRAGRADPHDHLHRLGSARRRRDADRLRPRGAGAGPGPARGSARG